MTPLSDGTLAHILVHFIFLASRIIGLHFATNNIGYLRSNIYGALRKTILFVRDGCFDRSRASKFTDIGANRKRVCDFLLVRSSNFGPILHRFGDLIGLCAPIQP